MTNLHLRKHSFPAVVVGLPGAWESSALRRQRGPLCPPHTSLLSPSFPLLQHSEASRQSELIAARSGKSSLVSPATHGHQMCGQEGQQGEASRGEQLGDPFESFLSRLCFQVYCVRDTVAGDLRKMNRLPVQSCSGL